MRSRFVASALCCFVMAVGCNEVAGIKDPVSGEGGAGGTSGAPASGVDRFYGTWSSTDGSVVLSNCPDAKTLTNQSGSIVLAKTADVPLVFIIGGCNLTATVSGDVASLNAGQGCVAMGDANNATVTFAYGSSSFTLDTRDPTKASESLTAKATLSNPTTGATIEVCDYEESATFTKL